MFIIFCTKRLRGTQCCLKISPMEIIFCWGEFEYGKKLSLQGQNYLRFHFHIAYNMYLIKLKCSKCYFFLTPKFSSLRQHLL